MRTISFVRDEKRRINIAKETLEVYAPLAGRVGFHVNERRVGKIII